MKDKSQFNEKLYRKEIISIIKEKGGTLSPADVALKTGFPLIHIKYALNQLAAKYLAEIIPTEEGGLLYKFGTKLKGVNPYSKKIKAVIDFILNAFKFLFKIIIMLTLVGYMIFYIILIIGLFVAISAKSDSDSDSDFAGDFILDLLRVFMELIYHSIFIFGTNPYEKYRDTSIKRPFYIRVFSFIFGDDQKEDPFDHDNNILKYLKSSKYITLSQAINLTGLSEAETRSILVNMVVKYNGDIEVNDDAIIIYRFNELEFTGEDNKEHTYAWNRIAKIPKLNYNKKGENGWIIAFNLFNLVMSIGLIMLTDEPFLYTITNLDIEGFFIFIYPLIFSSLFFLIPIIRYIRLKFIVPKVILQNKFLRALKQIFVSKHSNDYVESSLIQEEVQEKLYADFPSIFVHDFMDDKDVINITNYKSELVKNLN